MGYCIQQTDAHFFIPKEFHGLALRSVKALMTNSASTLGNGGIWRPNEEPVRFFSWVNTDAVMKAETLEEALGAWRWESYTNDNGDIDGLYFQGEKSGQDEYLFLAIAPYVKDGSYIAMRGEDGDIWRWYFDGQTCIEQTGKVIWE